MLPKRKLMIPGPGEVEDDILAAMGTQLAAHYGPEWVTLYNETVEMLQRVFRTKGEVFLLASSGSAAVEAALATVFAPGERVLIGVNGFFGERMREIAWARGLEVVEVTAVWGQPINPDDVATALNRETNLAGIIIVHHETSTGVLNPIAPIGQLAQQHGLLCVVDAVSSLGGEELAMDEWGIDVCVTSSNKCLGSFPGLAPVAVNPRVWELIADKPTAGGWYLNLQTWRRYADAWRDWHPQPVTISSTALAALHAGLQQIEAVGLAARIADFKRVAELLRVGVKARGFGLFVEGKWASSVLTAVTPPPHINLDHLLATLLNDHNIYVAGGIGATKGRVARVGHLGKARSAAYVNDFLAALDIYQQHHV